MWIQQREEMYQNGTLNDQCILVKTPKSTIKKKLDTVLYILPKTITSLIPNPCLNSHPPRLPARSRASPLVLFLLLHRSKLPLVLTWHARNPYRYHYNILVRENTSSDKQSASLIQPQKTSLGGSPASGSLTFADGEPQIQTQQQQPVPPIPQQPVPTHKPLPKQPPDSPRRILKRSVSPLIPCFDFFGDPVQKCTDPSSKGLVLMLKTQNVFPSLPQPKGCPLPNPDWNRPPKQI